MTEEMKRNVVLELKDLTIYYETDSGCFKAVNGIDLTLHRGEVLGVVGETGAGKTTTALGIMNLISNPPGRIVKGEILLEGKNILEMSKREMQHMRGKRISMIFQDPMTSLNPMKTVGEQISEVIRLHENLSRKDADVKAKEMLELVGIPGERFSEYPHQFSGGMKQRVVISMALACRPEIIIADEPTTALDVTIQAQILALLSSLQEETGTSMLLITHDLGVVAEMCDRVAVMYAGSIMELGTVDDIYDNMAHPYTISLFNALPDIEKNVERLDPIPGLMPDPSNLPEGCPFAARCGNSSGKCREKMPELIRLSDDHFVRCHLYSEGENE